MQLCKWLYACIAIIPITVQFAVYLCESIIYMQWSLISLCKNPSILLHFVHMFMLETYVYFTSVCISFDENCISELLSQYYTSLVSFLGNRKQSVLLKRDH